MTEQQAPTSAHRPDLDEVRAWLEKMIKDLRFIELVTAVISLITRMASINSELMKQLANLRKKRPPSETLRRLEKQLEFVFAGSTKREANAKSAKDELSSPNTKKSRKGCHPGRTELPASLERVPVPNPVPQEMRICPKCGSEMSTVGHETCERLEIIPARLVVVQTISETVACPHDDTIVSAPPPPQIVEKGKLGTTFVIEALADKYLEHQPIERQCLRWARSGVDVAPQTVARGVAAAIDLLQPIASCIADRTREPGIMSTDASGIPVLDRNAPDGIRTGTIWCWINSKWVCFVYSRHGDGDSVRVFLGDVLRPTVQCDGTSITNFIEREGGLRPGCMAHGRRRLVDAAKGGDLLALEGLRIIGELFAVERASARANESADQRKTRRQADSRPILDKLRAWIDRHRRTIPPKTPLGKALGYLHRQWRRLCLFLEDGRIELTNNHVERELRKLVLGRRNWLFTWEDLGGERTATILTIIGTCVAHGINPRAYLHVVARLLINGWPQSRLRDLLPDRIGIKHPQLRVPTRARSALFLRDTGPPALPAPA